MNSTPNGAGHSPTALVPDKRRALVDRILSTAHFNRSERLTLFLKYVSDCALDGRANEISEQQIGINVFGRPASYSTGEDNIVRTHARLVRQRLEAYFQNEGRDETLRLYIPRGTYVPTFEASTNTPRVESVVPSTFTAHVDVATAPAKTVAYHWIFACLGFIVGALLMMVGMRFFPPIQSHARARITPGTHLLWDAIFKPDRPTLIVVGDAGILMYENLARSAVTVNQYTYRTYEMSPYARSPAGYKWFPFALRTYTAFDEIKTIQFLTNLPEARGAQVRVVFARNITANDLSQDNIILLGGPGYDPWEHAFESGLNFRMKSNSDFDGLNKYNGICLAS